MFLVCGYLITYLVVHIGGLFFDVLLVVFLGTVKVRGILDGYVLSVGPLLLAGLFGEVLLFLRVAKNGRPVLGSRPPGIVRRVDGKKVV